MCRPSYMHALTASPSCLLAAPRHMAVAGEGAWVVSTLAGSPGYTGPPDPPATAPYTPTSARLQLLATQYSGGMLAFSPDGSHLVSDVTQPAACTVCTGELAHPSPSIAAPWAPPPAVHR
jgi:hypothetical protein